MADLEARVRELERLVKELTTAHGTAVDRSRTEITRLDHEIGRERHRLTYYLAGVESLAQTVARGKPGPRTDDDRGGGRH